MVAEIKNFSKNNNSGQDLDDQIKIWVEKYEENEGRVSQLSFSFSRAFIGFFQLVTSLCFYKRIVIKNTSVVFFVFSSESYIIQMFVFSSEMKHSLNAFCSFQSLK